MNKPTEHRLAPDMGAYIKQALKTSSTLGKPDVEHSLHNAVGLLGELGEFAKEKLGSEKAFTELMDILWYIACQMPLLFKEDENIGETFEGAVFLSDKEKYTISNDVGKKTDNQLLSVLNKILRNRYLYLTDPNSVSGKMEGYFKEATYLLFIIASENLENMKRAFFYNTGLTVEYRKEWFIAIMCFMPFIQTYRKVYHPDWTIQDMAECNALKLEARYKGGLFSEENQRNRDYENETKASGVKGE